MLKSLLIAGAIVVGFSSIAMAMVPYPTYPTPGVDNTEDCSDASLTGIAAFRRDEIARITPAQTIVVRAVCDGRSMSQTGNAGDLGTDIAHNSYLVAMLEAAGYKADEVIGIIYGANGSVHLYVHHS